MAEIAVSKTGKKTCPYCPHRASDLSKYTEYHPPTPPKTTTPPSLSPSCSRLELDQTQENGRNHNKQPKSLDPAVILVLVKEDSSKVTIAGYRSEPSTPPILPKIRPGRAEKAEIKLAIANDGKALSPRKKRRCSLEEAESGIGGLYIHPSYDGPNTNSGSQETDD